VAVGAGFFRGCRAMRKALLFMAVFVVMALGLSFILHSPLGLFLAVAIVVGGPLAYARFTGRGRRPSKGLYWRGYVSFKEFSLVDIHMFPDIRRQERTGGWGRKGLSSGRCEIRDTGIRWRSGGWATPQTEVSGTFDLPWSEVEAAGASCLPGKIPGLGGRLTVRLTDDRGVIEGEFLGSVKGLSEALASSRCAASGVS